MADTDDRNKDGNDTKPGADKPPAVFDPRRIGMPPAPLIEVAPDEWR